MATRIKLSGAEIRRLKNDLKDCDYIMEDFEQAGKAGVPNLDELLEKTKICRQRIVNLLTVFGGGVEE